MIFPAMPFSYVIFYDSLINFFEFVDRRYFHIEKLGWSKDHMKFIRLDQILEVISRNDRRFTLVKGRTMFMG